AITVMRQHRRIAACGAVSGYNHAAPEPGPRNMFLVVTKRLMIRGFIVSDSLAQMPAYQKEAAVYLADGRLKAKETIVEGLERAPQAFVEMMRGANVGKMIVNIA